MQGSSDLIPEGWCPAEFSSNTPQHTCLEVSSMPSKTLISCFRCVWLGLELNSAGHRPSRTEFGDPGFSECMSKVIVPENMWKWSDIQPSIVTHTQNLCSLLTHPRCTHTAVNTHTQQWTHTHSSEHTHTHTAVNTHTEQWAAVYAAAPGEQLGVRCLAQGSQLSRGIEGGERALYIHSPHLQLIPAGPRLEPATFWLRIQLSNH